MQWMITFSKPDTILANTHSTTVNTAAVNSEKKNRYMLPHKEVFRVTPLNGWAHGENIGFDNFKSLIPRKYYDSVDEQLIKIHEES